MNVKLAENSGFCPGVKRADDSVKALINKGGEKIYTLGKLIHNRLYNESLSEKGVNSVDIGEIAEILKSNQQEKINLVIRTHGIPKEENIFLLNLEKEYPNFHVTDMTCPYVKKIHRIAESNTNDDTVFLLFCNPEHPEAKGILSYANGEKYPFTSLEELKNVNIGKKVPILCSQTTQNLLEFQKIKKFLKKLYTNSIFFDTICNVTEKRQTEAISLAKKSDAMIVIGGRESSNTHKLYDLCKAECKETFWIESINDLCSLKISDSAKNIGITAGASTPDDIILEVLEQWKKN